MLGVILEMLGIMLEIPSISNQMCEKPSISNHICEKPILKFCIRNTWYFDRNSRFCIKILGFLFELIGFSFEITHLCYQNTKRETPSAYIHMSWDSLLLCTWLHSFWMTPRSLFAWILLAMRNNEENKREICILLRNIKKP